MKLDYVLFTNNTGYGVAAKNTVAALLLRGDYDIKLTPLDLDQNKTFAGLGEKVYNKLVRKKNSHDRIQIFHMIPDMYRRFPRNRVQIGVGVFETWQPPAHWVAILNKTDGVIVPSEFNHQEFLAAGVKKPIFKIPHCIDMTTHHTRVEPMHKYYKFTFLFLGSWRRRKGYKELLEAWFMFDEENAQLLIKTDKPGEASEYVRHMESNHIGFRRNNIIIDHNRYTDEQMPSFIKSADCLVSPTLGEGFGLPGLQAMALGVPIIITDHSGCQEYATLSTANLLVPEGRVYEKCMDGIPQFSRKHWVFISAGQIWQSLEKTFTSYDKAKKKAIEAALYVRTRFDYNVLIECFGKMVATYGN